VSASYAVRPQIAVEQCVRRLRRAAFALARVRYPGHTKARTRSCQPSAMPPAAPAVRQRGSLARGRRAHPAGSGRTQRTRERVRVRSTARERASERAPTMDNASTRPPPSETAALWLPTASHSRPAACARTYRTPRRCARAHARVRRALSCVRVHLVRACRRASSVEWEAKGTSGRGFQGCASCERRAAPTGQPPR
jgi:hypothetical protein